MPLSKVVDSAGQLLSNGDLVLARWTSRVERAGFLPAGIGKHYDGVVCGGPGIYSRRRIRRLCYQIGSGTSGDPASFKDQRWACGGSRLWQRTVGRTASAREL